MAAWSGPLSAGAFQDEATLFLDCSCALLQVVSAFQDAASPFLDCPLSIELLFRSGPAWGVCDTSFCDPLLVPRCIVLVAALLK